MAQHFTGSGVMQASEVTKVIEAALQQAVREVLGEPTLEMERAAWNAAAAHAEAHRGYQQEAAAIWTAMAATRLLELTERK